MTTSQVPKFKPGDPVEVRLTDGSWVPTRIIGGSGTIIPNNRGVHVPLTIEGWYVVDKSLGKWLMNELMGGNTDIINEDHIRISNESITHQPDLPLRFKEEDNGS